MYCKDWFFSYLSKNDQSCSLCIRQTKISAPAALPNCRQLKKNQASKQGRAELNEIQQDVKEWSKTTKLAIFWYD